MSFPSVQKFRRCWFPQKPRGLWAIPESRDEFDVFLLMGQSNMAGYGCIVAQDPWHPGDLNPIPGVLTFGGQGTVKSARPRGRLNWSPATHPLHLNQNSAGFGLGLEFARQLQLANPTRSIGLLPCAWGGAPISVLGPGTAIHKNSLKRARMAAQRGRLRAVLWHQGESDTDTTELATAHAERLLALIAGWRHALELPKLPFLIGDLAPFFEQIRRANDPVAAERVAVVRAGLRRVADADPDARFVESRDLTGVDPYHFGRRSLIEFGHRYAREWTNYSQR